MCLIRTQVQWGIPIKISNYPLPIFFLDPPWFATEKTCQETNTQAVGHLPREISRATKFLIDRGAKVEATISSNNYRRSPFVQSGLEIPCKVSVTMPATYIIYQLLKNFMWSQNKRSLWLPLFLTRSRQLPCNKTRNFQTPMQLQPSSSRDKKLFCSDTKKVTRRRFGNKRKRWRKKEEKKTLLYLTS